jgi:hypothetical protein
MAGAIMSEDERTSHGPFGRFRLTTEPMDDGREIHYYEWRDSVDRPVTKATPTAAGETAAPAEPASGRDE